MNVTTIVATLLQQGVQLWSEGDRLGFRTVEGQLSPELRAMLVEHKQALLTFLGAHKKYAPASFAQQRLWYLDQINPGSPVYTIPVVVRLEGKLVSARLAAALHEIVRRHEALRTTFELVDQEIAQVIWRELPIPLRIMTLAADDPAEQQARVQALVRSEVEQSFNLMQGPLARALLLEVAPQAWVLSFTIHHSIFDGWSMNVLIKELVQLYQEDATGQGRALSELTWQYSDFAAWQRHWLQSERLTRQLTYWRARLEGAPPLLMLPTDYVRPSRPSHRGSHYPVRISPALTEGLRSLAREEGATLFMVLLGIFQLWLARCSGQRDIVVGTPITNRTRLETQGIIGFFANTLALRLSLADNPSFRELIQRVRQIVLEAQAHQDVPFEKVVELLQPERDRSYHPLFQTMFTLQALELTEDTLPGLRVRPLAEFRNEVSKFDLSLMLSERSAGLTGSLEYDTALFKRATIKRMVGHLEQLVAGIVAEPLRAVWEIPWLSPAELQQWQRWNATHQPRMMEKPAPQLFEEQVERSPEAVAVVEGTDSITYRVLNERANQLARHLRDTGCGAERFVGVMLERSIDAVNTLLAIWKVGAVFVPLPPSVPPERLALILAEVNPTVILTHRRYLPLIPTTSAYLLCLDSEQHLLSSNGTDPLCSQIHPEQVAYITYTSGSTGKPKGVMVLHRGVSNALSWFQEERPLGVGDRTLHKMSLSFDAALMEVSWPLIAGATIVIVPPTYQYDSTYLLEQLRQERITFLLMVPAQLQALLAEPAFRHCHELRYICCGGDILTHESKEQFLEQCAAHLDNAYGPTETTWVCTVGRCTSTSLPGLVPIGHPIANARLYILDGYGQPLPVGVPGELYIGGQTLARGYLQNPALTAERFLPDPFSAQPGMRMYRTGDAACYLPDGSIQFLGRIDQQVKVRGFRIEPGEIEAALLRVAAVRETVVVLQEPEPGRKRLVAYVVPEPGETLTADALRVHLQNSLPEYMIPNSFMMLPSLPLTSSGKVDRRSLPVPDKGRPTLGQSFVAPRTPLEQRLAEIWATVLGVEQPGVHDDFFALGGYSLLAVQLLAQIRKQLGHTISLIQLLTQPTVAHLAFLIEGEQIGRAETGPLVPLQPGGEQPPFFCVHAVGGTVFRYRTLAQALAPHQPFYGVQAVGLQGERPPLSTIVEMASHYVAALRTHQPAGPYFLGGWSVGSFIALEMAQQLQQQGESIGCLLLLDPPPFRSAGQEVDERHWMVEFVRDLVGASARQFTLPVTTLPQEREKALHLALTQAAAQRLLPPEIELAPLQHHFAVYRAIRRACHSYQARPYVGSLCLLQAEGTDQPHRVAARRSWESIVQGSIEHVTVPGDHHTMFDAPYVSRLARAIGRHLEMTSKIALHS